MFPSVCKNVAHDMGKDILIPSSSIYESTTLVPLNIVAKKKKRRWIFFHKVEYSSYGYFPLHNLLTVQNVLESPIDESEFGSYNEDTTYSVNGKFGADILKDIGTNFTLSDKVTISANLGKLTLCGVSTQPGLISEPEQRQLNMEHELIKQIKGKGVILCVIHGVIKASDKAEIKRTDINGGNGNIKIRESVDVKFGGATSKKTGIMVEAGTVLAYKVWELKINVTNGSIVPVMTTEVSGGFSTMDGNDCFDACVEPYGELTTVKDLEDRLQPILDLTESDGQSIKSALLKLMTCPRDVVVLSRLLSKAEDGHFKEDRGELEKQFVNTNAVLSLLNLAGVKIEETSFFEEKTTPMFTAVAHVVDALAELESKDLEYLCQCNQQKLKVIYDCCKSAVTSDMPIKVDTDKISQDEDPASSLLIDLDFTLYKGDSTVLPPKTKTCVVECIFCVLYCLFGKM